MWFLLLDAFPNASHSKSVMDPFHMTPALSTTLLPLGLMSFLKHGILPKVLVTYHCIHEAPCLKGVFYIPWLRCLLHDQHQPWLVSISWQVFSNQMNILCMIKFKLFFRNELFKWMKYFRHLILWWWLNNLK